MKSIIPKSLEMSYFMSCGRCEKIEFQEGIDIFVGKNGEGKSTVLDAIHFVLFGTAYSKKTKPQLINWKSGKGTLVRMTFDIDGKEVVIERGIKPDIQNFTLNGDKSDIVDAKDFTAQVCKILGLDAKVFKNTNILSEEFYEPFLKLTPASKRDFFKRIFSFEKFENMEKAIKADKTLYENKLVTLEREIEVAETRLEETVKSNDQQIVRMKEEIESNKKSITENDKKLAELTAHDLSEKLPELEKLESDMNELSERTTENNNKISVAKTKIESEKSLRAILERNKKSLIEKQVEIKTCDAKIIEIQTDLVKTNTSLEDWIDITVDYIDSEIDRVKELKIETASEQRQRESKKSFYESNDVCDQCGHKLNGDDIHREVEELTKSIESSKALLAEYDIELLKLTEQRTVLSKLNSDKLTHEKRLHDIITKMKTLQSDYDSMKRDIDSTTISDVTDLESEIESLTSDNVKITKEIEPLKTRALDIKKLIAENSKIESEISTIKAMSEHYVNLIKTTESSIKNFNRDNEKDHTDNISELKKKQTKGRNVIDALSKMVIMISDKGIKKYIIGSYIPVLNEYLSVFSEIIGSDFQITFTSSGMDLKLKYRGKEISIGSLSSGQRQRVNLVILFTFIKFNRMKSGASFPMIFFDEILNSSLDEEGITGLIEILEDMKGEVPYITIITHSRDTVNFADRVIEVKREGGFSKYNEII